MSVNDWFRSRRVKPQPTPTEAAELHLEGFKGRPAFISNIKQAAGPYIGQTLIRIYVPGLPSRLAFVRKGEGGFYATVVKQDARTVYEEIPSS